MELKKAGQAGGFTLMEVVIALSLAGMLMAGIFMTFQGAISAKSVEAAGEGFGAVLRATQSRALATKAVHVVYVAQTEYVVAQFVKSVLDASNQWREVPMLMTEVEAVKDRDIRRPDLQGFSQVKWLVEKRSFKRAIVAGARWLNNQTGGRQSLMGVTPYGELPLSYDLALQRADSPPQFIINAEGQLLGHNTTGTEDAWVLEGISTPSFVTFASQRELSRMNSVVVFQGAISVKPGQVVAEDYESKKAVVLTMDMSQ